jgi:peptidoglycan/xylan/chitin deacetylase (PgdA/CDA1 family)
MKKLPKCIFFLLPLLVGTKPFLFSQNVHKESNLNNSTLSSSLLDQIKICRWKGGAFTCVILSFDDNEASHKQISLIMDDYNYKGSFFVISSYMRLADLKDILSRGHEIGNHSYSHCDLTALDSTHIEYEIVKAKEDIEKTFGIKCSSIATPYHTINPLVKRIAFKHQLFIRNISEYANLYRNRLNLSSGIRINDISSALNTSIKNEVMLLLAGHGIDGNGWDPITSDFLKQTLDTIKKHSDKNEVWVTTLKEGAQYENMVHEMQLDKQLVNDTLVINCRGYLADKYKNLDQSALSIEIPKSYNDSIQYFGKYFVLSHKGNSDIITIDLKKTDIIKAYFSTRLKKTDTINIDNKSVSVFPNPATSLINIASPYHIIKTEVYNLFGELELLQDGDIQKLNVSKLKSGLYIVKISTFSKVYTRRIKISN